MEITNNASFLRAIRENPEDESLRKVYADWLEEQGSPARAQYVRLMMERAEPAAAVEKIDVELKGMLREVGRSWVAELYPKPGRSPFHLEDGHTIYLDHLEQYFTYGGLLEGLPTDEMNKRIIDRLVNDEKHYHPPYLVPSKVIPIERPHEAGPHPFGNPERLPSVTCLGKFECREPVHNPDEDGSSLTIIWFQDEMVFPITDPALSKILVIDWVANAVDFQY